MKVKLILILTLLIFFISNSFCDSNREITEISNDSDDVVENVPTADTIPDDVSNLRVTVNDNGLLTITWKDPNISNIDYIELTINGEKKIIAKGTERYEYQGRDGELYIIMAKVVNKTGKKSEGIEVRTTVKEKIPDVTDLKATVYDNNEIVIEWKNPDCNIDYIELIINGEIKQISADKQKITIDGIKGKMYTCVVKVVSTTGKKSEGKEIQTTVEEKDDKVVVDGDDYKSPYEDPDGKLEIRNYTGEDFVLFKDKIGKIMDIMSASETRGTTYKFDNDMVVLIGVPKKEYESESLSNLKPTFYELLYYNHNGHVRSLEIEGFSQSKEACKITFVNEINAWVELRIEEENGPAIGVLKPAGSSASFTDLYLKEGIYQLFPVFTRTTKKNDRVIGIDKQVIGTGDDAILLRQYKVSNQPYTEYINAEIEDFENLIYDRAYIALTNSTSNGFYFRNGAKTMISTTNDEVLMPGDQALYEIKGRQFRQLTFGITTQYKIAALENVINGYVYEIEVLPTKESNISEGMQIEEWKTMMGID